MVTSLLCEVAHLGWFFHLDDFLRSLKQVHRLLKRSSYAEEDGVCHEKKLFIIHTSGGPHDGIDWKPVHVVTHEALSLVVARRGVISVRGVARERFGACHWRGVARRR